MKIEESVDGQTREVERLHERILALEQENARLREQVVHAAPSGAAPAQPQRDMLYEVAMELIEQGCRLLLKAQPELKPADARQLFQAIFTNQVADTIEGRSVDEVARRLEQKPRSVYTSLDHHRKIRQERAGYNMAMRIVMVLGAQPLSEKRLRSACLEGEGAEAATRFDEVFAQLREDGLINASDDSTPIMSLATTVWSEQYQALLSAGDVLSLKSAEREGYAELSRLFAALDYVRHISHILEQRFCAAPDPDTVARYLTLYVDPELPAEQTRGALGEAVFSQDLWHPPVRALSEVIKRVVIRLAELSEQRHAETGAPLQTIHISWAWRRPGDVELER